MAPWAWGWGQGGRSAGSAGTALEGRRRAQRAVGAPAAMQGGRAVRKRKRRWGPKRQKPGCMRWGACSPAGRGCSKGPRPGKGRKGELGSWAGWRAVPLGSFWRQLCSCVGRAAARGWRGLLAAEASRQRSPGCTGERGRAGSAWAGCRPARRRRLLTAARHACACPRCPAAAGGPRCRSQRQASRGNLGWPRRGCHRWWQSP